MKRLIALLMVLCLVMGLGACKDPVERPDGTGQASGQTEDPLLTDASTNTTVSPIADAGRMLSNDDLIDPEKFGGKKLQIYGYHSVQYEDLNNMEQLNFIWMIRAAVDEWAALNNVEVEFVGGYDQNVILGDIDAGGHPDLLLYCNKFPITALTGITRPFTQEEYNALAATCGTYYLDMIQYKGQSYGVLSPWSGGQLFYYNKTQFEKYGVKSPGQYFMEDNWNWDTYETCIKEITRDEDGDGINELYGSGSTFSLIPEFYVQKLNMDGTLTSLIRNSDIYKHYLNIYYSARQSNVEGKYAHAYTLTSPRPATSFGFAEWYDFTYMHRKLDNGDVIEAIPAPKYTNNTESFYEHENIYSAILRTCDEPEAAVALLNYILRVGMRFMSDYSLGLYKCNYQGIRGASEYAADWKVRFDKIIAERMTQFDKLTDFDPELQLKTINYLLEADVHYTAYSYPEEGGGSPIKYPTIDQIADREEKWIAKFNEVYAK